MVSYLSNFSGKLRVALIGATGGIGRAFLELLTEDQNVEVVYAFSRSPLTVTNPKIILGQIDITDESAIRKAAQSIATEKPIDVILVTAGLLHEDSDIMPEKSLSKLSFEKFERVFAVNTFGPAMVAKHFLPLLAKDKKGVFAVISARVGSISDNQLGGWYAYRASKAALNMLLKTTAIEFVRSHKQSIIVGLHPGTVDTELSKPFQANVPEGKLFTPDYSAKCLLGVLNDLTAKDTGKCLAYDGKEITP